MHDSSGRGNAVTTGLLCGALVLSLASQGLAQGKRLEKTGQPSTGSTKDQRKLSKGLTKKRLSRPMFSLEVRLLTGDINVSQQWGDKKVIYQPAPLSFRYKTLAPGAAKAEWQVAAKPFRANDLSGKTTGLLDSGPLGRLPTGSQMRMFNVDFSKFLPPSPPSSNRWNAYYVRLVGLNADNEHYGLPSRTAQIVYKRDSSQTKFTDVGLLTGPPRIDRVEGPWKMLDAGNRPILAGNLLFVVHGRNFPKYKKNLKIKLLRKGKLLRTFAPGKITGSGNRMRVHAKLPKGIERGTCHLQLAVVDKDRTYYKPSVLVHLAAPPVFSVVFKGLKCLEETDEVGPDEPYAVFMAGYFRGSFSGHMRGTKSHLFSDVDKGEFHPASVTVLKQARIPKAEKILIVGGLMENDEGIPNGIVRRVHQECDEGPQIVVYKGGRDGAADRYADKVGSFLRAEPEMQYFDLSSVDNRDDYVGAKELRLSDKFLRACRTTKGWRKKSLVIGGDGGRYRLDFAIKADPK